MRFKVIYLVLVMCFFQSCLKIDNTDAIDQNRKMLLSQEGNVGKDTLTVGQIKSYKSLLGTALETPPLNTRSKNHRERQLAIAKENYEAVSDSLEYIIWYGRRLCYLYKYYEGIDVYTKGLKLFSDSYELYRHRGHRYLTTRKIDLAVKDLEKAAFYVRGISGRMEEDGLPNRRNIPRSSIQFNIWYHLGLAYYLSGNYDKSVSAYKKCVSLADNHDMLVSSSHWLYMTYRKLGNLKAAEALLEPIHEGMNIIENFPYLNLLLMYKGEMKSKDLFDENAIENSISQMTIGYGVGNFFYLNGQTGKALNIFNKMMKSPYWQSFGYLAAEVEIANREILGQ